MLKDLLDWYVEFAMYQIIYSLQFLSMGQNNTKEDWLAYSSKDFFKQQVDFYRWRADPLINTHICRVNFQHQESLQDKEKLKILLQRRFGQGKHISLDQILMLANQTTSSRPQEELMSFQNYISTLHNFQETLTLEEALYALHTLFSGYEVLFHKLGRLRIKLIYTFVTKEGQVRAWFNKDYKSNEVLEEGQQIEASAPVLNSEMAVIKKIIQFGQKLVTNHTEFLHFSRQFRSYMERDILHNWTFGNARKLINSYAYTYRINFPNDLKEVIKRRDRSHLTTSISETFTSNIYTNTHTNTASNFSTTKTQFISTGDAFARNSHNSSNSSMIKKQLHQRPVSLSDYSSKKSEDSFQNYSKTHQKKNSSTDLKHLHERAKLNDTPKVSRSQIELDYMRQDTKNKEKNKSNQSFKVQEQIQKVRKDREIVINSQNQQKMNTTVAMSPKCNSFTYGQAEGSDKIISKSEAERQKAKQNSSILKQHQFNKQKKKLQKKAAVVSKYISFYQQTKNQSINMSTPQVSPSLMQQSSSQTSSLFTSNNSIYKRPESYANQNVRDQQKARKTVQFVKKPISFQEPQQRHYAFCSPILARKSSVENHSNNDSFTMPFKGKTECLRSNEREQSNSQHSLASTHNKMFFTLKAINGLIQNNDVSVHQSNGSFMSIERSDQSEYQGVLSKMGRSVDIMNLPSNRQGVNIPRRPPSSSNQLNRVANY